MAAFYDPTANRSVIAAEWRQLGWSDVAIAGMLGRASRESSFNTTIRNPNDAGPGKDSVGLFQWNRGRLAELYKFANKQGMKWSDPKLQARYVHYEITQGAEKATFGRLQKAKTVQEAADAAMMFTRPKNSYKQSGKKITWTPRQGLHYKETLADANKFAKEIGVDPTKMMVAKDLGPASAVSSYLPSGPSLEARDERAAARLNVDKQIVDAENVIQMTQQNTANNGVMDPSNVAGILSSFLPKQQQAPTPPSIADMSQLFKPRLQWATL